MPGNLRPFVGSRGGSPGVACQPVPLRATLLLRCAPCPSTSRGHAPARLAFPACAWLSLLVSGPLPLVSYPKNRANVKLERSSPCQALRRGHRRLRRVRAERGEMRRRNRAAAQRLQRDSATLGAPSAAVLVQHQRLTIALDSARVMQ
jgi:hypothetical protein